MTMYDHLLWLMQNMLPKPQNMAVFWIPKHEEIQNSFAADQSAEPNQQRNWLVTGREKAAHYEFWPKFTP